VPGSNQRPPACKAGALPTELTAQNRHVRAVFDPCVFTSMTCKWCVFSRVLSRIVDDLPGHARVLLLEVVPEPMRDCVVGSAVGSVHPLGLTRLHRSRARRTTQPESRQNRTAPLDDVKEAAGRVRETESKLAAERELHTAMRRAYLEGVPIARMARAAA
jgi:hypothetical protein